VALFDGHRFLAKQSKKARRAVANMSDPVRGIATVVSSSDFRPVLGSGVSMSGAWECSMTCVIRAEGVPAQTMHFDGDAPTARWPWPGKELPITVDRAAPGDWVVHWDEVPTGSEASQAAADSLAASMRTSGEQAQSLGQLLGGATVVGPGNVVDLRGNSEAREQVLRALGAQGIDVGATKPAGTGDAGGSDRPAPGAGGDLSEQLARLGELHANGTLTDAEFQEAKAKLLGS
jgi:hypothetical protein